MNVEKEYEKGFIRTHAIEGKISLSKRKSQLSMCISAAPSLDVKFFEIAFYN